MLMNRALRARVPAGGEPLLKSAPAWRFRFDETGFEAPTRTQSIVPDERRIDG